MRIHKFLALGLVWCLVSSFSLAADEPFPSEWLAPAKPFRMAGPIYYVGTQGLSVYLIKSSAGLALLGGALPPSTSRLRDAILALGFKLEDIRLLLVPHAHADHVGTLAELKKLTGARVVAGEADASLLESGGKTDYLFAGRPKFYFTPVTPDRVVKDGDSIQLGELRLIAHSTPGHTPGCTTWETKIEEGGHGYDVVFLDGTGLNPGTRFTKDASYPGIETDYRHTFATLEALHPDIFLAYHAEAFDLELKRRKALTEGTKAWIDPLGYRNRVAQSKAKLEAWIRKEKPQENGSKRQTQKNQNR